MEFHVMSGIDHEIDCYHQYIAQTDYQLECPEDGDIYHGFWNKPQESAGNYPHGPQSFGDVASDMGLMYNMRNGLNTPHRQPQMSLQRRPQRQRGDCGDYYNPFSGLKGYERPVQLHGLRNPYDFKL